MRCLTLILLLISINGWSSEKLIVGVTETAPFAMLNPTNQWTGVSIDLWESIAKDLGVEYQYVSIPLPNILTDLEAGNIDLAVGAISITSDRESILDFSHAYFNSGLGIVTKATHSITMLDIITNPKFITSVGLLLGFVFLGGILILIFENGPDDKDFRQNDISNGVWWSITTITTTGYGDLVPKTNLGRLFGGVWMVIGAIIAPMLIGSMSANLTLDYQTSVIEDRSDLSHHAIGVISGTSSEIYFQKHNLPYTKVTDVKAMMVLIQQDKLDGGVYDAPILQYFSKRYQNLVVLPTIFDRQSYGIVVQNGSDLRELINASLLTHIHTQTWLDNLNQYLGE